MDGVDRAGYLTTWNLGFYFDIKLKDPSWMIHTGVIVKSPMGADHLPVYSLDDSELDNEFSGGSVTRKLSYFNVPVMMKYRFGGHLYVEGGLQLGLLYKAVDTFKKTVPEGGDLSYKLDIIGSVPPARRGGGRGPGLPALPAATGSTWACAIITASPTWPKTIQPPGNATSRFISPWAFPSGPASHQKKARIDTRPSSPRQGRDQDLERPSPWMTPGSSPGSSPPIPDGKRHVPKL